MNRILLVIAAIAMTVAATGCATKQRKSRLNPDSNPHSVSSLQAPESTDTADPTDGDVGEWPGEMAAEELPADVENGESQDGTSPATSDEPVIEDPLYAAEIQRRQFEAARRAAIEKAHKELTGDK